MILGEGEDASREPRGWGLEELQQDGVGVGECPSRMGGGSAPAGWRGRGECSSRMEVGSAPAGWRGGGECSSRIEVGGGVP